MTPPTPSSRFLLVPDRRDASPRGDSATVRRFRLARLRLEGRDPGAVSRYEHLKRVYD